MSFTVIIPARLQSTRLPRKVLLDIAGKPMLQRVHERALASGAARVVIATDDSEVEAVASGFCSEVLMTSPTHRSGSDRLAEAVAQLGLADDAIVVNVQGDEPMLPAALIRQVAGLLSDAPAASIATLWEAIADTETLFDPSAVKLVTDADGYALYFSRAPIPWHRDAFAAGAPAQLPTGVDYKRHLGIYAYRVAYLKVFAAATPATLEQTESLEQLRALAMGQRIIAARASEKAGLGVDTEADLAAVTASVRRAEGEGAR